MPELTARLGMRSIVAGQADATVPHNEALHKLDTIICLNVIQRGVNTPPMADEGEAYIIGDNPEGDWDDEDAGGAPNNIAYFFGGQWNFLEAKTGFIAWVEDEQVMCRFVGSSWVSVTGESVYEGRKTSSETIAGIGTDIAWNSDVRKDGIFVHSTSSDQDQIVVGESGYYDVMAEITVDFVSGTGWQKIECEFTVNGATVDGSLARGAVDSNMDQLTITWRRTMNCSAGDIIRVRATHSAGGGLVQALANACRVHVRRV